MGCKPSKIDKIRNNEVMIRASKQMKKKYINNPLAIKSMISDKQIDQVIPPPCSNIDAEFYINVQRPTPLDQIQNIRKEVKSRSILASSPISRQSTSSSQKISSKKVRFSILDNCLQNKNKQKKKQKVSMETLENIF